MGVDILGVDILGVDILGVDISGVDILGVDILRLTRHIHIQVSCQAVSPTNSLGTTLGPCIMTLISVRNSAYDFMTSLSSSIVVP